MSVIDNIRGALRPPTTTINKSLTAPQVATKIEVAERQLIDLGQEHAQISLDTVSGVDGAGDRLVDVELKLAELRRTLATYRSAYSLAKEKDALAAAAARAAISATQLRAVKSHLDARCRAADEMTVALENLVIAWRVLVTRSEKAKAAKPLNIAHWPDGAICEQSQLKDLVAHELWRLSAAGNIGNDTGALPGAAPTSSQFTHQPAALKPMADIVKEASAHTLNVLQGKVAG